LNFDSLFLPGIGHQLIAPLSGQLNSISRSSPPLTEELPCGSGSGHLSRLAESPPFPIPKSSPIPFKSSLQVCTSISIGAANNFPDLLFVRFLFARLSKGKFSNSDLDFN